MSGERPVLAVRGLRSGYGDLEVLRGISLEVAPGTIEVVLGRNGVGKTTLLHTISGLVAAREGSVDIAGRAVTRMSANRRVSAGVSLVQEGKQIFRERTVMENLTLGSYVRKLDRSERHELCLSLLKDFPALDKRQRESAAALSGGQQQMLAIAQALAAGPRVLMLDEPSAGLAPAIVAEVFEHVGRLRDQGMAVLLVEQLAEQALAVADHVTVIDDGRIVAAGAAAEFSGTGRLEEVYFGVG